jgi:predicted acylesterase/phospholipase RssA
VTAFNSNPEAYQGFWVDGGVLNNLPIHAFDANFIDPAQATNPFVPLNERVVALRLTNGFPPGTEPPRRLSDPEVGLGEFLEAFMETVLYPSEGGQLRSEAEVEQTIDLYTYDLDTVEFAPPPEKSRQPIEEADSSVERYFNPGL